MHLVDYKIVHTSNSLLILKNVDTDSEKCYRVVNLVGDSFRNVNDTRTAFACDKGAEHVTGAVNKIAAICMAIDADIGIAGMIDVLPDIRRRFYDNAKMYHYKKAGLWFDIE